MPVRGSLSLPAAQQVSRLCSDPDTDAAPAMGFVSQEPNWRPRYGDVGEDSPGVAIRLQHQRAATAASAPLLVNQVDNRLLDSIAVQISKTRYEMRRSILRKRLEKSLNLGILGWLCGARSR
jgi:hypothetical protein